MFVRIIRIIAILFAVVAAAIILPRTYRTTFPSGGNRHKTVSYSEIINDFIISEYVYRKTAVGVISNMVYTDSKGKQYSKEEVSGLLLLDNVSQLAYEGRFPDTLCGVPVTPSQVSAEAVRMYYSANPGRFYGLLELRDQKSYTTTKLEPKDLFRINKNGIEFIDCESNKINEEKSRIFNDALKVEAFQPPAKMMWTPGDRTASEMLGYYVIDNKDELYQLSMNLSVPDIRRLPCPDGKKIRNIIFSTTKDFISIFITEDGSTYLQFPEYRYLRLPLPDAIGKSMVFEGNFFFRRFNMADAERDYFYVFDRNYQLLDSLTIVKEIAPEKLSGRIYKYLFPFNIRQTAWNGFFINWSPVIYFVWLNLLLAAYALFFRYKRGYNLMSAYNIIDILIVLIFGLFGFIGIFTFPMIKSRQTVS